MSADAGEVTFQIDGAVAVVTLNRPPMNALCRPLMKSLAATLEELDGSAEVRVIVLTGSPKAFAAGADIKEMDGRTMAEMSSSDHLTSWDRVGRVRKPVVAAVSGYALGGGCELALACDMILASESAVFGQPEIDLGIIPGAGGTQRLTHILGKQRAMELVLAGRRLGAREAQSLGLVNRVFPAESFMVETLRFARALAGKAPIAARAAKEAVLKAVDTDLETGLAYERRLFCGLFATDDQKEGIRAFIEKREPVFTGK